MAASRLFEPLALRSITLPNRIMVSPMCQYSAVDGNAGAWHHAHLGSMALSGAGLVCVEATAVTPEGRITPGCLGLWSDTHEAALAPVVATMRAAAPAAKIAIQLAHAGRKASSHAPWDGGGLIAPADGGWVPGAPSALAHGAGEPPPRALSIEEIEALPDAFAAAAARAARLGFDAVELHLAHGYLLHQFLSPISNRRNDDYGGSFDHRVRLPLAVFEAVRAAFPSERPVGVRVSATDWLDAEEAWTLEQTIELAQRLKARRCDWIDVSSGGISPRQKIALGPGYQVPFAEAIRRATGLTTIAVGLITEPNQAEAIVASGQADMVALARAMLLDPRWPWRAALALGGRIAVPRQYWRAVPNSASQVFGPIAFGQR
jgi:2,4-dienoyl-CoA reductase-like NADH-dependent reductase (Old Yellow Enzyme family)